MEDKKRLIKELRERTGLSMRTCEYYLDVTNYNFDDALELVRETAYAVNTPISRAKTLREAYEILKGGR